MRIGVECDVGDREALADQERAFAQMLVEELPPCGLYGAQRTACVSDVLLLVMKMASPTMAPALRVGKASAHWGPPLGRNATALPRRPAERSAPSRGFACSSGSRRDL